MSFVRIFCCFISRFTIFSKNVIVSFDRVNFWSSVVLNSLCFKDLLNLFFQFLFNFVLFYQLYSIFLKFVWEQKNFIWQVEVFFVTKDSFFPREPWYDSEPALFGDPNPINVLQEISVGFLIVLLFLMQYLFHWNCGHRLLSYSNCWLGIFFLDHLSKLNQQNRQ